MFNHHRAIMFASTAMVLCLLAPVATAAEDEGSPQEALAKAWTAFYAGKYDEAVKTSAPVMKLADASQRSLVVEAAHLQARSYWAYDNRAAQARATKLWTEIEKIAASDERTHARLKIAEALQLASQEDVAKTKQAIALLEPIAGSKQMHVAVPEAAVLLAEMYSKTEQYDKAEKLMAATVKMLQDPMTARKMELADDTLLQPHLLAARAVVKQTQFDRNPGSEDFEEAERLRREEKYRDAAAVYQRIIRKFPETDYAIRSELHIGDCMVGLGQKDRAIRHWKEFIEPKPAGPWRAQAYINIINYHLEDDLNLREAGKYAELARASLPSALGDSDAKDSWAVAAFDVQLRVGLVKFCEGKGPIAADAFVEAARLAGNEATAERMQALAKAAESGKPVIPEDCQAAPNRTAEERAEVLLSMGVIYMIAHRWDSAEDCFDRILGLPPVPAKPGVPGKPGQPPMRGISKAQQAFATFGRGAAFQERKQTDEAIEQFQLSMQLYRDGSWHDESLYRIATIMQDDAEAQFEMAAANSAYLPGQAPSPGRQTARTPEAAHKKPSPTDGREKGEGSSAEDKRKAAQAAENARLAARAKAFETILPYWQEIIERYPDSPRVEPAMYNIGLLYCGLAEAISAPPADEDAPRASAKTIEAAWQSALDALAAFTKAYPQSPLAGDAYVKQMDIALEQMFDLQLAAKLAPGAVAWAEAYQKRDPRSEPTSQLLDTWASKAPMPGWQQQDRCVYECYLRGAVLEYLAGNFDQANTYLKLAGPIEPPAGGVVLNGNAKFEKIGLHYFQKAIASRQELVDAKALEAIGDDKNLEMAVRLGDLYLWIVRPDKAEPVFLRVAEACPPFENVPREIRGYCIAQMALAVNRLDGREEEAQVWFAALQKPPYKGTHWAGLGLYRQAVTTFNRTQDSKQVIPLYLQMIHDYPTHPKTERAYTYLCLNYLRINEIDKAKQTAEALVKAFPDTDRKEYLSRHIAKAQAKQNQGE